MPINQSLIGPYKTVLLKTTLDEINRHGLSHLTVDDFEILSITEDSVVGTSRLVIDAHIPNVQRIRVYLYWDGVHGNSQLYYERVFDNNTQQTLPLITQVVRDTGRALAESLTTIRVILRIPDILPPGTGITGTYSGSIYLNNALYFLPADTTTSVAKVEFLPNGSYTVSNVADSSGRAIITATVSHNDKIMCPLDGQIWQLDPTTDTITVIDVLQSYAVDVIGRTSTKIIGYSKPSARILRRVSITSGSLPPNYLTVSNLTISNFPARLHDMLITDDSIVYLATSDGLYTSELSAATVLTQLHDKPVYSVIQLNSGNIVITAANAVSLTPDIVAIELDFMGTIVQTVDLPEDVNYLSPPVVYPSTSSSIIYYGSRAQPHTLTYEVDLTILMGKG